MVRRDIKIKSFLTFYIINITSRLQFHLGIFGSELQFTLEKVSRSFLDPFPPKKSTKICTLNGALVLMAHLIYGIWQQVCWWHKSFACLGQSLVSVRYLGGGNKDVLILICTKFWIRDGSTCDIINQIFISLVSNFKWS